MDSALKTECETVFSANGILFRLIKSLPCVGRANQLHHLSRTPNLNFCKKHCNVK